MFWFAVAFVAVFYIAYAAIPKPQNAKLGTVEAPTAEEGRPIAVLFGTKDVSAVNITWYGDIKTRAVKASGGKK